MVIACPEGVRVIFLSLHYLFTPLGGLSKTEIATLTDTQIDEILASHITLIPSSVFSVSKTFLCAFVSFQSEYITPVSHYCVICFF